MYWHVVVGAIELSYKTRPVLQFPFLTSCLPIYASFFFRLENFLFSTSAPDSELKMIDFGLSKHFDLGEVHHEQVGTPYTCAPEILRGSYDEKSDIWSLGVITYLLLR